MGCMKVSTNTFSSHVFAGKIVCVCVSIFVKKKIFLAPSSYETMMECLVEELGAVRLNLNTSKTKILTTESLKGPMFLAIGGDRIEMLHG